MDLLLIEDDDGVIEVIKRCLRDVGVVTAEKTWKGGYERSKSGCYPVILLDLGLPDSTTQNTLKSIRDLKMNCPNSAVIVVTGQPSVTDEMAMEAGADGFIHKQEMFTASTLIQLVSNIVAKMGQKDTVKEQLILHGKAVAEVAKQFNE